MTIYVKDRVRQSTRILSTTPTVQLLDVAWNHLSFADAGLVAGNTFPYRIESEAIPEWEIGIGTMINSTSFTRTSIIASSNGGAATDFKAGIKYVEIRPSAANMQTAMNPTAPSFADVTGSISLTQMPSIPTTKITGALPAAQIGNLAASKITSGIFDAAQIPTLSHSKVDSYAFSDLTGSVSSGQLPAAPTFTDLTVSSLRVNVVPTVGIITATTHYIVININGTDYRLMLSTLGL